MCLRRVIGPLPSGVYLFKTAMAISKITRWIVRAFSTAQRSVKRPFLRMASSGPTTPEIRTRPSS